MKNKFSSMGRVAIALVLALSLTLVMAAPVAAFVTSATVTIDPTTISRPATYTIEFTTTADLYLTEGHTITITFPDGTTVPEADIAAANVTVNGTACATAAVTTDQLVEISVPEDVPFGPVVVVIDKLADIKNPGTIDTWTLDVQTSQEPSDVESQTYSTTAITAPTILSVAGTAYQNSNDTIVITFSEDVMAFDDTFNASEEVTIECGGSTVTLASADFSPDDALTETLTITLVEAEASLEIGTNNLEVTPVSVQIENEWGDAFVAVTPVLGSVVGDTVAPTVALTYSDDDQLVKENDNLTITATFSEAMQDTPTISIDTQDTDLEAVAFTTRVSGAIWEYTYVVTAGSDGEATVTVVGKDLAGTANLVATNNTFVIDNTAPFVAVTGIIGSTTGTDTIAITFSEDVVASDDTWDANEVTSITLEKTDETDVPVILTAAEYAYASKVLTIELAEAGADTANKDYLLNGYTLTVDPHDSNRIEDLAGNLLDTDAVEGTTPVTGDLDVPTITRIVGVSTDTIQIAFSELVVAFAGSWSANEFSIESPDGAPLNINNATFNSGAETVATTVLTIVLEAVPDAAVLVEGEAILVTPTADAVVDLAGNPLAAVEETSGADSGWLEIWVDDSWTGQTGVDEFDPSLIWGANAFKEIGLGLDAVGSGGTVNVAAGTYNEQVIIDKADLTVESIDGADVTFIDGTGIENTYPAEFALVSIQRNGITFKGFTVQNAEEGKGGVIQVQGFNEADDPVKISECLITDNTVTSTLHQEGIYLLGASADNTISNNRISETFWDGIKIASDELCSGNQITGNIITSVSGNHYGIFVTRLTWDYDTFPTTDFSGTVISDNEVSIGSQGIGVGCAFGSEASPIVIQGNYVHDITTGDAEGIEVFHGSYVNMFGNVLEDNGIGIQVKGSDCTDIVANYNDITGSTVYGVEAVDVPEDVDATLNWWGTAFASDVADMVTGDVDYSPWLDALAPYGEPTTTGSLDIQWEIDLAAGWNLISLPLICIDSSIDTVLAGADVTINKVAYYTGGDAGTWDYYNPPPVPSDLTTMDDGKGYWIDASEVGMLTIAGVELAQPGLAPPSYELVVGWNLIGLTCIYEDPDEKKVQIYLGPAVMATVEAMYKYDADTGLYAAIVENSTLTPGDGYWLAVNADGRIYP